MAPGANYMGGKRNAARARSKDTTGRTHKTFFSRQRLDILSKELRGRAPSGGSSSGHGQRASVSDIGLSHARHLVPPTEDLAYPVNVSSHSRSPHRDRSHVRSSSGSRSSKILEVLDTTEPLSMRAALDKILSFPDLAGLSEPQNSQIHTPPRATSRLKRSRPSEDDVEFLQEREQKRQKSRIAPSYSPSNVLQQDENFEELEFEYMDMEDPITDASSGYYYEQENDFVEQVLDRNMASSSSLGVEAPEASPRPAAAESASNKENRPSTPVSRGTTLLQPSRSRPRVSLSSHSAGLAHTSFPTPPPSKQGDHDANYKMVLRDNLFEYHDPWGAIGIILGLEEGHMDTTEMKISESSSADARSEILLDQSKAPEDAFCEQSQHFYGHHSSNSAPSSPLKNDGRAVFSYLDEREHHELGSPVASANPALQSKSDSDDEDIPFGDAHIHDASIYKPDDSRRNATPTNQSAPQPDFESKHFANESTPASPLLSFHAQVEPLVHSRRPFNQPYPTTPTKTTLSFFPHEAEPLADSNYDHGLNQSNPTTPNTDIEPLRSSRRIPKHCLNSLSTTSPSTHFDPRHESTPNISVSSHLDDFRAESEISPRAPGSFPPSITGKFQKFPKFPLPPIALHRPAAYNSTYIRPAPPIHSSRGSSNSSPPLPSQIQGSTSSPLVPLIRTAARTLPYIRASPPVHSPRGSSKSSPPPPSPQLRGSTPSPLIPLNRITARTFPYIVPMSPVHSPRGSSKSSPRAQSHQPTGTPSRSRFSLFNRPRDQAELPRSAEIDTEPIFKLGRPTDIQDTRRAALVRDEEKETIESEGCAPQRFFGDLCLFADDIDAPDSDE